MKKIFRTFIIVIILMIFSGCKQETDNTKELKVPNFYIDSNGLVIINDLDETDTYEIIVDGNAEQITKDKEIIVKKGQVIKIRAISEDISLYKNSQYSDEIIFNEEYLNSLKLNIPSFSFTKNGNLIIEPQEGVTKYGIIINNLVERIISINDEIILKNYDKIKIRAISENSIFESSDYSEVKTYLYSDFGLTQLTIPTISINYDYEITFNEHSDTDSFSISINNKEEVIVKSNEKVTVKIGDTIKIKSVAEKDNQVDSEYKTYYISEIRTYSVPRIQYSHYGNKKFSFSYKSNELAQYRSDKIWLKLNDEILATTIDDLEKISFKTGDKISIKFRTDAPLSYFENEEWSNVITYYDLKDLHYLELSGNKNKLSNLINNGDGTYTFFATTSNGEKIELLIEGEVKESKEGWAILGSGTKIRPLNNLDGIVAFEHKSKNDLSQPIISAELKFGADLANESRIMNIEQITYDSIFSGMYEANYLYDSFEMNHNQFLITNHSNETEIYNLKIWYSDVASVIIDLEWNYSYFGAYIPGEKYDISREDNSLIYYLLITTHNPFLNITHTHIHTENYVVGNIKESDGTIVSKENRKLKLGDTLEMSVGQYSEFLPIVIDVVDDKKTLHEVLPFVSPEAVGTINNLVIPLAFNDQNNRKTEENMELIYKMLGNIIDEKGNVVKYSPNIEGVYSLSEYYNIASYNKIQINSFVTDWYDLDISFENNKSKSLESYEGLDEKIIEWVLEYYPNLNMSLFDKDGNALFDSIIFINTADMYGEEGYYRTGFAGAYRLMKEYTDKYTNTLEKPGINTYININLGFFFDDQIVNEEMKGLNNKTLIHEYGHVFGLVDYYDTIGSLKPLGGYDMQDANLGDWNPFSKYSVGWITPNVITEEVFNGSTSIDVKIESFTETGGVLLIPAISHDYNGTPFDEYIMLELFTPTGLNKYDSIDYGINETIGVKMYHVNAVYEKRVLIGKTGENHEIGTIHFSNSTGLDSEKGHFLIEVIQSDKVNTLTSKNSFGNQIEDNDFFKQGDVFKMEEYKEFFYNGLMDNELEFGYTITIKEINTSSEKPYAIITISK